MTRRQLPASYVTFNDPNDRVALTTLARQFPGREVVGINCTQLIWGMGALHCMTRLPA